MNVKVHDTSIRLFAPTHKGALLPYIGELEFSTVIEGNSPKMSMSLGVLSFSLLFIDDLTSSEGDITPARASSASHGVPLWKVRLSIFPSSSHCINASVQAGGYALLTEITDLVLSFKRDASVTPPDDRVSAPHRRLSTVR